VLERPAGVVIAGVVIEKQIVLTRDVVVIEKQVVLFLLRDLPILYICFPHKCKPVGIIS
jgi:hypothetical protein